jgi:hypothetical protein
MAKHPAKKKHPGRKGDPLIANPLTPEQLVRGIFQIKPAGGRETDRCE